MNKITHKDTNLYIFSLAFLWLLLFENRGIEPQYFLLIKFGVMIFIVFLSTLFGEKENIEIQNGKLILSQKKVHFSIDIDKIESLKLLDFDREILIQTKDIEYRYKAYSLGKNSIEKFFKTNGLLIKNNM